ncbi:MAG: DUF4147 domain-containing protein [Caldilineaceae bacterium]
MPDAECVRGCQRIRELAADLTERDLVFTMCGNGVSALLTQPADGVDLDELRAMTYLMQIDRGADFRSDPCAQSPRPDEGRAVLSLSATGAASISTPSMCPPPTSR